MASALDMPEIMSYIYSKSWKHKFSASSSIIIIEDYYLQTFLHSLEYSQYDYKFTVLNRKNQLKSMYTMTNNHCCITDKDYKDTYYTIDDTSTYNELIEFAKSLVD